MIFIFSGADKMGIREKLNKSIREIGIRYGMSLPSLNSNNVCTMRYKDQFNFIIEAPDAGTEFYFYSPLVEKTDENNEQLQKKLLEQNFLFTSATGAALSLDEQTGDVIFCQVYAEKDLCADKLEQNIENFLSEAEKKREMVLNWMHLSKAHEPAGGIEVLNRL